MIKIESSLQKRKKCYIFYGKKIRGRLTGRTWDFGSQNRGSNPRPGKKEKWRSGREVEGARLLSECTG
jgi:hypothetical protein